MPAVVKKTCCDHDFDKINPTHQYLTYLQKRIVKNRKMLDKDCSDSDSDDKVEWQKDAVAPLKEYFQSWKVLVTFAVKCNSDLGPLISSLEKYKD
eukprot:1883992-Ditylum_brightwellii.AAC.1